MARDSLIARDALQRVLQSAPPKTDTHKPRVDVFRMVEKEQGLAIANRLMFGVWCEDWLNRTLSECGYTAGLVPVKAGYLSASGGSTEE